MTEMDQKALDALAESFREDADAHISDLCRKWSKEITGGNCTFVDDDLRILAHLANRAVKAGLTDGLPPSIAKNLPSSHTAAER